MFLGSSIHLQWSDGVQWMCVMDPDRQKSKGGVGIGSVI